MWKGRIMCLSSFWRLNNEAAMATMWENHYQSNQPSTFISTTELAPCWNLVVMLICVWGLPSSFVQYGFWYLLIRSNQSPSQRHLNACFPTQHRRSDRSLPLSRGREVLRLRPRNNGRVRLSEFFLSTGVFSFLRWLYPAPMEWREPDLALWPCYGLSHWSQSLALRSQCAGVAYC